MEVAVLCGNADLYNIDPFKLNLLTSEGLEVMWKQIVRGRRHDELHYCLKPGEIKSFKQREQFDTDNIIKRMPGFYIYASCSDKTPFFSPCFNFLNGYSGLAKQSSSDKSDTSSFPAALLYNSVEGN